MHVQLAAAEVATAEVFIANSTPAACTKAQSSLLTTARPSTGQPSILQASSQHCLSLAQMATDPYLLQERVQPDKGTGLWELLVDADSPSVPCSPESREGCDAILSPSDSGRVPCMATQGLRPTAPEPRKASFLLPSLQQPDLATADAQLKARSNFAQTQSVAASDCSLHAAHVKQDRQQQKQHSAGCKDLIWEDPWQQRRPASAGQQLQRQLQQSQQQLLQSQEEHKQRIAQAFGQCISGEAPVHPAQQAANKGYPQPEAHWQGQFLGSEIGIVQPSSPQLRPQPVSDMEAALPLRKQQQQRAQAELLKSEQQQQAKVDNQQQILEEGDQQQLETSAQQTVLSLARRVLGHSLAEAAPRRSCAFELKTESMLNRMQALAGEHCSVHVRLRQLLSACMACASADEHLDLLASHSISRHSKCCRPLLQFLYSLEQTEHSTAAKMCNKIVLPNMNSAVAAMVEALYAACCNAGLMLHAGKGTSRHCRVMSSLDMNEYFGQVANHSPTQQFPAGPHSAAKEDSLAELSLLSSELENFSAPLPDSFVEECDFNQLASQVHDEPQQKPQRTASASALVSAKAASANQFLDHFAAAPITLSSSNRAVGAWHDANRAQTCGKECSNYGAALASHSSSYPIGMDIGSSRHPIKQSTDAAPESRNTDSFPAEASVLATSWPGMSHAPKLRHGRQLRQAAAEAAAVAAGQAARAESAVRLMTPPTIAFHSKAAQHAIAATEAAAALAAITADEGRNSGAAISPVHRAGLHGAQVGAEMEEDHMQGAAEQSDAPTSRQGHLHASAPASPMALGRCTSALLGKACQGLGGAIGKHAGCSLDSADFHAPAYLGVQYTTRSLHTDADTSAGVRLLVRTVSAPSTPVSAGKAVKNVGQQPLVALSGHHVHEQRQHQQLWQQQQQQQDVHGNQKQRSHLRQHGGPSQAQISRSVVRAQQVSMSSTEDPFTASEQFPICPELSLSLSLPSTRAPPQCIDQLANAAVMQQQQAAVLDKQHTRQRQKRQQSVEEGVTNVAEQEHSAATQSDSCLDSSKDLRHVNQQPAVELSSLTEDEFWKAARADLLDTAEAVRRTSRSSDLIASTPVRALRLPTAASKIQPHLTPPSGITPLLGKLQQTCAAMSGICHCIPCAHMLVLTMVKYLCLAHEGSINDSSLFASLATCLF